MSHDRSWYKVSQPHTETAMDTVRRCVAALRSRGLKTDTALRDLADILGTTHRRVRTLFHRDYEPVVLQNEWHALRFRAGLFFLNEAQRLRRLADRYEASGEDLISDQPEFTWEKSWDANAGSTAQQHGRAA